MPLFRAYCLFIPSQRCSYARLHNLFPHPRPHRGRTAEAVSGRAASGAFCLLHIGTSILRCAYRLNSSPSCGPWSSCRVVHVTPSWCRPAEVGTDRRTRVAPFGRVFRLSNVGSTLFLEPLVQLLESCAGYRLSDKFSQASCSFSGENYEPTTANTAHTCESLADDLGRSMLCLTCETFSTSPSGNHQYPVSEQ